MSNYTVPTRPPRVTLGDLVFNEWTPDGYLLKILRMPGWKGTPSVRRESTPRLWAHGEFTERGWRGARLVTIEGRAMLPTNEALVAGHTDFVKTLAEGVEGILSVDDPIFGKLRCTVTLSAGSDLPGWEVPGIYPFQMQVVAADGRKYSDPITDSTGVPIDGGGLSFDQFAQGSPGVLDFGQPGNPGYLELTNSGTASTSPIFTVTGNCPEGFTITNRITDARLVYESPVLLGQTVVLDAGFGSVQVNGIDAGPRLVRREFEALDSGETGSWFLTAPNSVGALLRVEVAAAWW